LVEARKLLIKHQLRSLDALQLASAVVAEKTFAVRLTFVTADKQLFTAATAEGFTVDDPNLHP
jgi:predicted nucleic acid-binding protein